MGRKFTLNGTEIPAAEITFGTVREMTNLGVDFSNPGKDMLNLVSAYTMVSTGQSRRYVDNLIQHHIVNGGNFEEIIEVFRGEYEDSAFFQALAKTEKAETE